MKGFDFYRKLRVDGAEMREKYLFVRSLVQLSKDGDFIREWHNEHDAARELGINQPYDIIACAMHRKGHYSCGGYVWEIEHFYEHNKEKIEHIFKILPSMPPKKRPSRKSKPVVQYDEDGNCIHEYESISAAAKTVGGVRYRSIMPVISKCCHRRKRTGLGYVWKFK